MALAPEAQCASWRHGPLTLVDTGARRYSEPATCPQPMLPPRVAGVIRSARRGKLTGWTCSPKPWEPVCHGRVPVHRPDGQAVRPGRGRPVATTGAARRDAPRHAGVEIRHGRVGA